MSDDLLADEEPFEQRDPFGEDASRDTDALLDVDAIFQGEPRHEFVNPNSPDGSFLTAGIKYGYACGHALNDFTAAVWFSYLLLFLEKGAGLTSTQAGLVFLAGQITDAVMNPIAGGVMDWVSVRNPGAAGVSQVICVLLGSVVVAMSFCCVFSLPDFILDLEPWTRTCIYCGFGMVFNVAWAVVQVAHLSLVPKLSPRESDWVSLNSMGVFGSSIATIGAFGVASVAFSLPLEHHLQYGALALAGVVVGLLMECMFFLQLYPIMKTRQKVLRDVAQKQEALKADGAGLTDVPGAADEAIKPHQWLLMPIFWCVLIVYTMSRVILIVFTTFLAPYLSHITSDHKLAAKVSSMAMLLFQIATCLVMLTGLGSLDLTVRVCKRLGLSLAFTFSAMFSGLLCLLFEPLSEEFKRRPTFIYVPTVLLGAATAMMMVVSRTMIAKLVRNSKDTAYVYGVMGFAEKSLIGGTVVVVQEIHAATQGGYGMAISWIPFTAAVMGCIIELGSTTMECWGDRRAVRRKAAKKK